VPLSYENLPCPGCGEALAAGEDIVTCPDCGAPQHRECWLKDDRCALSERHGESFVWQPPALPEPERAGETPLQAHINRWEEQASCPSAFQPEGQEAQPYFFCPNCGRKNQNGSMQCENCGYLFFAPTPNRPAVPGVPQVWISGPGDPMYVKPEQDLGGALAGDLALFIQRYARTYLYKFKQMALEGKRLFFNLAACVFRGYWFIFRKMYSLGLIFLLLTLALNALQTFLMTVTEAGRHYLAVYAQTQQAAQSAAEGVTVGEIFGPLLAAMLDSWYVTLSFTAAHIALGLAAGFIADRLYYKRAVQAVGALRRLKRDEADFQFAVLREGGVSVLHAVIAFMLMYLMRYFIARMFAG